ncbi:MAG: hypothetical protein MR374_03660 [Clostridia bacterium]|nr:hypothetical protein [Clostridia bacterium]
MKTYDVERKELFDWLNQETEKYFSEVKKAIEENRIQLDSNANSDYLKAHREYNQKLLALKMKYGII